MANLTKYGIYLCGIFDLQSAAAFAKIGFIFTPIVTFIMI